MILCVCLKAKAFWPQVELLPRLGAPSLYLQAQRDKNSSLKFSGPWRTNFNSNFRQLHSIKLEKHSCKFKSSHSPLQTEGNPLGRQYVPSRPYLIIKQSASKGGSANLLPYLIMQYCRKLREWKLDTASLLSITLCNALWYKVSHASNIQVRAPGIHSLSIVETFILYFKVSCSSYRMHHKQQAIKHGTMPEDSHENKTKK